MTFFFREIKVHAPYMEQPQLGRSKDELTDAEAAIYDCFSQKEFVDKLIAFCSLETKKGYEKFDTCRYTLFKVSL